MKKIDEFLNNVKTVCITGHVHPDGDCAGSTLGLYNYIVSNYPDLSVDIYLDNPTDKLSFLASFDKVNVKYDKDEAYDIMFVLDSATLDRVGKAEKYFKKAKYTVNIDHHVSDIGFADEDFVVSDSSSASEVVFDMMDYEKINQDVAICLYTGILYDTGVFKYSSTSSKTMEIVSKLMKFDIPTAFIIDESFYAKTYNENRIYGYAILKSKLHFDGKVISSFITKEEMKEFDVTTKELDGIVSQLRLTLGVECSVFMYELVDGNCKLSLRSSEYLDVNEIANCFGGGGHVRASGATLKGNIEECVQKVLDEVEKRI